MFRRVLIRMGLCAALLMTGFPGCRGDDNRKPPPPPPPPADLYEPNDDPGMCAPIALPHAMTGLTIHNRVDEDHYCFTLICEATLIASIGFPNRDGNLDLQILDQNQVVIDSSTSTVQDLELIVTNLPPGDYSLRVWSPDRALNTYAMDVEANPARPPCPDHLESPTPNDDPTSCTPIPVPFVEVDLTIHTSADEDWFCFTLPVRGTDYDVTIDILFQNWVGNLDLELYDDQQNLIDGSYGQTDGEQIVQVLPEGRTYVLRVYGAAGDLNRYDLSILGI